MGFAVGLVWSHVAVCPWLLRDVLNNEMRLRVKGDNLWMLVHMSTSVIDLAMASDDQKKGDRPAGTTGERKNNHELAVTASKNKICVQYNKDKKISRKK